MCWIVNVSVLSVTVLLYTILVSNIINKAFKIANSGKKGAVHIDIPKCIASSKMLVNEYNQHMQNVPPIRPTAPPMEIIQSIQEEANYAEQFKSLGFTGKTSYPFSMRNFITL